MPPKFEMMFHAALASFFAVIAMLVFGNYIVLCIDPAVRNGMESTTVAGILLLTIGLLTAAIYNVYMSVHWFIRWHTRQK